MHSRWRLPECVQAEVKSPQNSLDVTAVRSKEGKTVQLQVVNLEGKAMPTELQLTDFMPAKPTAKVVTLSGALDDVNTPEEPEKIAPQESQWRHDLKDGKVVYTFPPYSFTILRFRITGPRRSPDRRNA